MDWLQSNWVVLAAIAAIGTSWGAQQSAISGLQDKAKDQAAVNSEQSKLNAELREQTTRIDERTKLILDGLTRQQKSMDILIDEVKKK
jgi:hypothetical protein